jgi:hypothetical protein
MAGQPFPHTLATYLPAAGETMAQARARASCTNDQVKCIQIRPSMNVLYSDVWTDPAAAGRASDKDLQYRYDDVVNFPPQAIPTTQACLSADPKSGWNARCRAVINYPQTLQVLWDLPRQTLTAGVVTEDHTCSRGGCHSAKDAAGAAQVPAGQLNLTNTASNEEPLQPISYRHLLFPHNQQAVTMGALQDLLVAGPPDANGKPTLVPTQIGPFMNAGSANGAASSASLALFAPNSGNRHANWLSPAELRLISEWLDIGAQFFNNPFDPKVPVN